MCKMRSKPDVWGDIPTSREVDDWPERLSFPKIARWRVWRTAMVRTASGWDRVAQRKIEGPDTKSRK